MIERCAIRPDNSIVLCLLASVGLMLNTAGCPSASAPHATRAPSSPDQASTAMAPAAAPGTFADNPIVYFVITDRFKNGNPDNDRSYGRAPDGEHEIGSFHGGDLAGLTEQLKRGYFSDLGVNALWITAPYEQIHGWVVGGSEEFKHYAYHGYYALDFTVLDDNMGTDDELKAFVDTAHSQNIRVIFDIVMNHPGYADLWTLAHRDIKVLWDGWENATPRDYHSFINYNDFNFTRWWGPDWVRAGLPGYDDRPHIDDRLKQLAYLPDFKTESDKVVKLPAFLASKPDTRAREIPGYTVRQYLIAWLTDWVRTYGIDGFRCDTAKHVDLASWAALKQAGVAALREWKAANPDNKIDDAAFWMTGEVFPHGVVKDEYFDNGFDSLINFDLQERVAALGDDRAALDELFAEYAAALHGDPEFNVLSYLSSHDTALFDRDRLIPGGTALLLAPGGVQIFYGDETARPLGPQPKTDPQQATRSAMNWQTIDKEVLSHWQTLGQFRRRHVALAKGRHARLSASPYTFSRVHDSDRVVVALGASGPIDVIVGDVFADGDTVQDAYTGARAVVRDGKVSVTAHERGVVLLEQLVAR